MRVSTNQMQQLMMTSLQRSAQDFSRISQQMATGIKNLKPSDDPMGMVQLMSLKKEQSNIEQYQNNIGNVRRQLGSAETYVTSLSDTLLKVRDITLEAGNGAFGLNERKALASELETLKEALQETANAKGANGLYLFSGSQQDKAPIAGPAAGDYSFQGDTLDRQVNIGSGVKISGNVHMDEVFFNGGDLLKQLDNFINVLNTVPGDVSADVGATLDRLDIAIDDNLQLLTDIGTRVNNLDEIAKTNDDIELYSQTLQLELESLDYAQASMELSQSQLALQTTQQVYVKVNQLSLFHQL